jgi:hypothetical protein
MGARTWGKRVVRVICHVYLAKGANYTASESARDYHDPTTLSEEMQSDILCLYLVLHSPLTVAQQWRPRERGNRMYCM